MKEQSLIDRVMRQLFYFLLLLSVAPLAISDIKLITSDPHRSKDGFFDVHVCNWPDRPPFYLALYGTEAYAHINSIEVFDPSDRSIGKLNLKKFIVNKSKDKPERHVFLTQFEILDTSEDGWYRAEIEFDDRPKQSAKDFIIHQTLGRSKQLFPKAESELSTTPERFKWKKVDGASFYKVFIKDMWDNEKLIHTSDLLMTDSYAPPKGLLRPGGYYAWRIHARDVNEHVQLGDFNIGSLSKWTEFTIAD